MRLKASWKPLLISLSGVFVMSQAVYADLNPPLAERHPHEMTQHDETRVDPYFWLREQSNPKVIDYLKAENAYTQAYMADTEPLQKSLYQEMVGYLIENDRSVPRKKGDYYYYSRIAKGQNYRVYCRKKGSMQAPEEVLLDLNQMAEGKDYLSLGIFEVSPNHRYLAYSLDESGAESYTLYVRDLESGEIVDQIKDI